MGEKRENLNKIIKKYFTIVFCIVPSLELHCNTMSFLLAFDTSHKASILVFSMSNAKKYNI